MGFPVNFPLNQSIGCYIKHFFLVLANRAMRVTWPLQGIFWSRQGEIVLPPEKSNGVSKPIS